MADDRTRSNRSRREPWHRTDRSGSLRAGVFGVSDGLVSNTALVMGFAGSGSSRTAILLAGVAGLLAGAFSMAAGEYVSMSSQREMYQREISLEAREVAEKPEEERAELVLLYRAKGLDRADAERLADRIMANPEVALDTLAREELGQAVAISGSSGMGQAVDVFGPTGFAQFPRGHPETGRTRCVGQLIMLDD
ncbi:MAG: VIT1/CCC1 transporter family protein [Pseudonocardiaceae bacterium]